MAEQKAKVVHGPGPRGMGGPRPKVENPGKLLKRIMAEVFQHYLPHCILVLICIVVSALANVQASLFLQTLIDDYIIPMTQQQDPSFAPLAGALVRVGCIYVVGILAAWLNARIMVNVTQGTLRNLRTQLFTHMESLPISYFDTHPHGDIMSVYTNDVDTLRQMLSQSIPQLVSSAITIVSVFASMCMLSWQLTIVTMLMVALMLFCSKKITQQSGKYFIAQQRDLGKVNGYIEEMMEGQKVVKVFTHEQKALEGFRELNDKLKDSAKQANSFANIMMPVNAQLGNISYAICALVGAAMAVTGMGGVTLGTVMAFLSLNKSFNMPISQVSMQANSIIMALAGAERIFKMMDDLLICGLGLWILELLLHDSQYLNYYCAFFAGLQNGFLTHNRLKLRASHVSGCFTDAGVYFGRLCRNHKEYLVKFILNVINIIIFFLGVLLGGYLFLHVREHVYMILSLLYVGLCIYYFVISFLFFHKPIDLEVT